MREERSTLPSTNEPKSPVLDSTKTLHTLDGREMRRSGSADLALLGRKARGGMMKFRTINNVTDPSGLKLLVQRDTDVPAFCDKLLEGADDQQVRGIKMLIEQLQMSSISQEKERRKQTHTDVCEKHMQM